MGLRGLLYKLARRKGSWELTIDMGPDARGRRLKKFAARWSKPVVAAAVVLGLLAVAFLAGRYQSTTDLQKQIDRLNQRMEGSVQGSSYPRFGSSLENRVEALEDTQKQKDFQDYLRGLEDAQKQKEKDFLDYLRGRYGR